MTIQILALTVVSVVLPFLLAKALPHGHDEDQTQRWKIAVLYAISAFAVWPVMLLGMWLLEFMRSNPDLFSLRIAALLESLANALVAGICMGGYFASFVLVMAYWKVVGTVEYMRAGAALFDRLADRLRGLANRFR